MTEPGMEAVLASLMAEHVSDDEATTGKGDPLTFGDGCECWVTDEKYWFRYGSAVEPGSQGEWNPACPVHKPHHGRIGERAPLDSIDWCTCGVCWECTR